jgi:hypothetical protein
MSLPPARNPNSFSSRKASSLTTKVLSSIGRGATSPILIAEMLREDYSEVTEEVQFLLYLGLIKRSSRKLKVVKDPT